MKMINIFCNVSTLAEVLEIVKACQIDNYQIVEKVTGKTSPAQPHLDTEVWPGYNSMLILQSESKLANQLVDKLREFNKNALNKEELVTFCSWELQTYFNK